MIVQRTFTATWPTLAIPRSSTTTTAFGRAWRRQSPSSATILASQQYCTLAKSAWSQCTPAGPSHLANARITAPTLWSDSAASETWKYACWKHRKHTTRQARQKKASTFTRRCSASLACCALLLRHFPRQVSAPFKSSSCTLCILPVRSR